MKTSHNKKRFILIDDDDVNNLISQMTIQMILGNVSVESFTNPAASLQYLQTSFLKADPSTPAILLLDLNMPVMNGWEFLDRFDSLPIEIKSLVTIFILSSSVDHRDRERSYSSKNVTDFLVKPLTKDQIEFMLEAKVK